MDCNRWSLLHVVIPIVPVWTAEEYNIRLFGRRVSVLFWTSMPVASVPVYIVQSRHQTIVLTDSKPCCQGYEKLCRGEFSNSPRVATYLSTVSRYQVRIQHLSGSANTPADFASRNAPPMWRTEMPSVLLHLTHGRRCGAQHHHGRPYLR